MTLDALIMFAGTFVAVLPFLGFPNSWDTVLLFLAGACIISLGIVIRRRGGVPLARGGTPVQVERETDGSGTEQLP